VIWFRAGLVAVMLGVVLLLALSQTASTTAPTQLARSQTASTTAPTPVSPMDAPTRVPLPTAPPQLITSRAARETPLPRATPTAAAQPSIDLVDNGYFPAQIVVQVGATVAWVNTGSDGHDVTGTGPGGIWRSGPLAPADRYQRSFGLPGTYDYTCTVHPEMRGRLIVQP
jgi:plastocyanin